MECGDESVLSPCEVLVKCHLRYDDAEEMEILEVPSGCVRGLAALWGLRPTHFLQNSCFAGYISGFN